MHLSLLIATLNEGDFNGIRPYLDNIKCIGRKEIQYSNDGKIKKIGDSILTYKDGFLEKIGLDQVRYDLKKRVVSIGNERVEYDSTGKITKIGSEKFYYSNGQLWTVGEHYIYRTPSEKLYSIGQSHITYAGDKSFDLLDFD